MYKDYLALIGEIVIIFNNIEQIIFVQIWRELHLNPLNITIGPLITSPLSYKQKCDLLRTLLVENNDEEIDKSFKDYYSRLIKAAESRNYYIHSLWTNYEKLKYKSRRKKFILVNHQQAIVKSKIFNTEKMGKEVTKKELELFVFELKKLRDDINEYFDLF